MLEIKNVYKTYSSKNGVTHRALENVSLKFNEKGLVFILGKSGSGKSTLLNLIGGIDSFDRGDILIDGQSFLNFKEAEFDNYRNSCIGFVFQDFNLLDNLTVYDNVTLALDLQSKKDNEKVLDMLNKMEVGKLKNRKINELSGGQKQRVSIARALIKDPKIILADEPTGALDSDTSDAIIKILANLSKERLVIVVTHNKEIAYDYGDRIIEIRDGFVLKDLVRKKKDEKDTIQPTLVSSNLVIIPKNQEMDDINLHHLNVTISEKRQDYYLLVDSDKNRTMSLFPNVKEVISDENNEELFQPFHFEEENATSSYLSKVKSNLPISKAIKFSLSNLRKKKLRFFFTVLLAILSVILTGTAMNFTRYSLTDAIAASIEKDNGSFIEVSSSFALSDSSYTLQNNDIQYLQSLDRTLSYEYNQTFKFTSISEVNTPMNNDLLFTNRDLYGFLVCEDIEEYGYGNDSFKIIYEKENLTSSDYENGVYISSIFANTIIRYVQEYGTDRYKDLYQLNETKDLIDFRISTISSLHGTISFPVIGIFDVDESQSLYQRYASLYDNPNDYETMSEYQELARSFLLRMVVKPSFMENFKNTYRYFSTPFTIPNVYNNLLTPNAFVYSLSKYDLKQSNAEYYFVNPEWNESNFYEKVQTLKPNQVFVGQNLFRSLLAINTFPRNDINEIRNLANQFNKTQSILKIQNSRGSNGEVYQSIQNVEIVGIISKNSVDDRLTGIYLGNESFQQLSSNVYRPNQVLIKVNENENYKKLIHNLYENKFKIDNDFVEYFLQFASTMEKYSSFIQIGTIIWFIIVTLLLYSFISNSIKDNSKQIGILKALGANIKDIYKIFTFEALLIGILASLFGVLGFYFGGLLVNNIVTSLFYTFYFPIFNGNIVTILIMILSTLLILFISLIIPMSKIKNIKPIEVINTSN